MLRKPQWLPFSCWLLLGLVGVLVGNAQTTRQHPPPAPQPITPPTANDQEQTIQLTTDLVELRVVVTDAKGNPVRQLKKEDFTLLENNKSQEISFFNFVEVPTALAKPTSNTATVTPPAPTPEALLAGQTQPPARSVVLFADTLHLQTGNLLFVKQALRRFINQNLTERDLAALVTSSGTLGLGEQFTRDRQLLRFAVDRLSVGPQERASFFTPYLAAQVIRDDRTALQEAMNIIRQEEGITDQRLLEMMAKTRAAQMLTFSHYRTQATLFTLRGVVERLAQMPGQRLLLLFSDGFSLFDRGGTYDTNVLQAVTSRAARAGVIIYSIDGKGLQPPPGFSAEFSGTTNFATLSAAETDSENSLNALAADTGGKFLNNSNDLVAAAQQALVENSAYYTLAYYPNDANNPNRFRKLTVRLANHPDYKVRTQKGYLPAALAKEKAAKPKTADQRLSQMMLEPLARTELGVAATARAFEYNGDNAQVTLQVFLEGKSLIVQTANERKQFEVKIALMVLDSNGKLADSSAQTLQGSLRPERYDALIKNGLIYNRRLTLKPGIYQVRIGVTEPQTERVGTASVMIEVPDLQQKKRLTLSSLSVAATPPPPAAAASNASNNPFAATQPSAPAPDAVAPQTIVQGVPFFRPGEWMIFMFRLYQNSLNVATLDQLELQTEIWQGEDLISRSDWVPLKARLVNQDEKGYDIGGQWQLAQFQPGIYELRVNLRARNKKGITQQVTVFGVNR